MPKKLNILIIEDSEDDALLLAWKSKKGGLDADFTRVETQDGLLSALAERNWDLVLCDYSMPHLNGMVALQTIRGVAADLPVIIVSRTVGEDVAVEAMRAGANDYLMKGNLTRLVPAIERELRDTVVRVARKRAEEDLARSVKEKDVLLKEIHHRVKNNMQVICSLLTLQQKEITDAVARAKFEESRNRVVSMSLIHDQLYHAKDVAHIDFKEYLNSLTTNIAKVFRRHDVTISVDMGPVILDVNIGIPCGLIVNELVSNSLRHAFPPNTKGLVRVGITIQPEARYVLFVEDDGIGFPLNLDFQKTPSLGLQLVNALVGQIGGSLALSRENGTRVSITFPFCA